MVHLAGTRVSASGKGGLKGAFSLLGEGKRLVMHPLTKSMGSPMAHDEEPILTHPGSKEMARHVHDYSRFTALLKWGALICLVIAFVVLLIIS
jgi:hypothetical protein